MKQVSWLEPGPSSEPSAVSGASSQHLCKQGLNLTANKGYLPINTETSTLQFKGQELSNNDGYDDLNIQHIEEIYGNLSDERHLEKAFR